MTGYRQVVLKQYGILFSRKCCQNPRDGNGELFECLVGASYIHLNTEINLSALSLNENCSVQSSKSSKSNIEIQGWQQASPADK